MHMVGAAALGVWANNVFFTFLMVLFIGFKQMTAADSSVHQGSHGTLFKTQSLIRRLEFFYTIPYLRSLESYKVQHFEHHRSLSNPNDPVYYIFNWLGLDKANISPVWRGVFLPFFGSATWFFVSRWLPYYIKTNSRGRNLTVLLFYSLAFEGFYLMGHLQWLLVYWVVPFFLTAPAFMCVNEVAEHYKCSGPARRRVGFFNYFMHSEGYHLQHHTYPSIPWFKVKQANEILKPYFDHEETCKGFIIGPVLSIRRQMDIPYVPNFPNPSRATY